MTGIWNERWGERATGRVADLTTPAEGNAFGKILRSVARINGSELKFKRIARASSIDELGDLNAELTYALIFVGLGFDVCFEPTGEKGPDLSVSRDGQAAFVEVKRIRPRAGVDIERSMPTTGVPLIFQKYGQREKDTDKLRSELSKKFGQVAGNNAIVAVWCDDDDLEYMEHQFAVADMRRDSYLNLANVPGNILFGIFAGNWRSCRTGQQVYCPAFRPLPHPFGVWAEELEQISVSACVQYALRKLAQSE